MRKKDEHSLKDLIEELIDSYKWRGKLSETQVVAQWEKLMGPAIVRQTEKLFVKNHCLYLKIRSAVLKQELFYGKEKLLILLNDNLSEQDQLKKIVFL